MYLQGLGQRLLADGFSTPFLYSNRCFMNTSLEEAKESVANVGEMIAKQGFPSGMPPVTFVFTGAGNVSKGALEMFELLPHKVTVCQILKRQNVQLFVTSRACIELRARRCLGGSEKVPVFHGHKPLKGRRRPFSKCEKFISAESDWAKTFYMPSP